MCGILGVLPSIDANQFKGALNTMYHRGPDSYGIESIDNDIILGHRRLAIIDLTSDGHQPMFDFSKRYSIVFNGEIYNYLEVKSKLEKRGYNFITKSDTEVLLNSFIEWGENCVLEFNGMWAFAIWDREKKELFISRDRYGEKPLFYAEVDGRFIFASEMKAIYPFLPEVKPSKDFHWMKNNVMLYESTDKCLIDGIKRFPYAHSGIYRNSKLEIKRYWNTLDHLVTPPSSYEDQVLQFRELFFDSCKLRMRSDVQIGTALSGGLDSSATLLAMAHLSKSSLEYNKKDWQNAYVACFPGSPLDESKYAKIVTDNLGFQATYTNIDPLKNWDKLEHYFYMFEELYLTSPIPMLMTYESVKNSGTTVTLDGHGADELFSGYGHILEALIDSGFNLNKIIEILSLHLSTYGIGSQLRHSSMIETYVMFFIKKMAKRALGKERKSADHDHPNFKAMDNFSRQLYIIFHETILPTLLRNYDRYSMMNSVEIRMPFMDYRLVNFVHSLPYSSKFGSGYTKKIIRDAMDPYMPKEITWRKSKIGFNSPIVDWMQGDLSQWFLDTVHERNFLESQLVDNPLLVQKRVMNIICGNSNNFIEAESAWKQLIPHIWEKAIIKRDYDIVEKH
jgi:asparagine synthase (glutamine-hydrolysing)